MYDSQQDEVQIKVVEQSAPLVASFLAMLRIDPGNLKVPATKIFALYDRFDYCCGPNNSFVLLIDRIPIVMSTILSVAVGTQCSGNRTPCPKHPYTMTLPHPCWRPLYIVHQIDPQRLTRGKMMAMPSVRSGLDQFCVSGDMGDLF